jgi:signal transduction histidine kinase
MRRGPAKGSPPKKKQGTKASARRRGAPKRAAKTVRAPARPDAARLARELKVAQARLAATSEILRVINQSPADAQPVFVAIAESAKRLLGSHSAVVTRVIDGMIQFAAGTSENEAAAHVAQGLLPYPLTSERIHARVARTGQLAVNLDAPNSSLPQNIKDFARKVGWRSMLVVPMLRNGSAIGTIGITRREAGAFDDQTIGLLKTFADQAVIAIENARLFNETKEALERQTATADILKVIASSPDDVQPVFQAIADRSNRIVDGQATAVFSLVDNVVHLMAFTRANPEADARLQTFFPRQLSQVRWGEAIDRAEMLETADLQDRSIPHEFREFARLGGYRSQLAVPLLSDGKPIGAITVTRATPGQFPGGHIQLLQTFADQAVIAIQNVRLFKETQEALERQTATADILKVIASSPDDVQPVFEAIAERSNRIVDGRATAVYRIVDGIAHLMAFTSTGPEADATLRAFFPRALSKVSWGEAIRRGKMFEIGDMLDASIPQDAQDLARQRGYRSVLFVPLLSEQETIGAISVTRAPAGKFADNHIQLLQTFADQAVIAISNVELFREVQQRTRDLSQSLDNLRAAQDRLVQTEKLASLGQLTAGIAHEIKNPLNFVNNFSALSAELTDELNDALKAADLTDKVRDEIGELTKLLKDNLEKVVQHGKRADSIVKNMLLHSREGAGEQRSADVNALVEESLNLAYHGARAEKPGFNITLARDFDADAGSAELYPQEVTRALLNLISNGFYAATRRKTENGEAAFEPMLSASTKDLGGSIEIRIRDNGTGIPPEVREKMFNPFFTTKPAGEGTGLGLSMTHDIVVKQHGGRIEVETRPGEFTEFVIVLPRSGSPQPRKG